MGGDRRPKVPDAKADLAGSGSGPGSGPGETVHSSLSERPRFVGYNVLCGIDLVGTALGHET